MGNFVIGMKIKEEEEEEAKLSGFPFLDPNQIEDLVDYDSECTQKIICIEQPHLKAIQWRTLGEKFDLPRGMKRTSWKVVSFALGHKWLCYKLGMHGDDMTEEMKQLRATTIFRWVNLVSHNDFIHGFLDLNGKKDRADHEGKRTPKDFHLSLVERFNDPEENDDLLLLVIKFVDETVGDLKEGTARFYDGSREGTEQINMSAFNLIDIKQSKSSERHTDNPWDYAERVCKELTGIGQLEAVYWYLFCTQTDSRLDEFNSFYGLESDSFTTVGTSTTAGAVATAKKKEER
mmetsp:Transcript_5679/g.11817  ORF Transcript_5679/g.11817 Transcript_5679/m.11817 type:complete len:290 (-) Transcript_5679:1245-2114(-)